ncbi:hypothetical protein [Pseudodesulfovibrio tunisiensis]|uniref:hypothetical protein n=1 Tax=Pseudodesulfovibrio tunisiensis TaxID=463192 RepID=UPI001FB45FDF|nr:hypothetical protein [Pseudodesulfovibrio tunisiensis]
MIAVPQSGPMTSRPRSVAYCFSAISCSTGTLSENSMTFNPAPRAFMASAPANSPGVEINARLASGFSARVPRREMGVGSSEEPLCTSLGANASAAAANASGRASSSPLMTSTRSLGLAAGADSSSPLWTSRSMLAGVPMRAEASSMPGRAVMPAEMRISATESWYMF